MRQGTDPKQPSPIVLNSVTQEKRKWKEQIQHRVDEYIDKAITVEVDFWD